MLTFFIPEKIPSHNKGEEAILRGIVRTLDFVEDKKIYLYSDSSSYDSTKYRDCAEIITETLILDSKASASKKLWYAVKYILLHLIYACSYRISEKMTRRIFRKKLWKVYNNVDVILAGHDNSYSTMHNFLILFCRAIKKPIVIYGSSILPYVHRRVWIKLLTRFCLNKADLITTRERITYNVLVNVIGIKKDLIKVTADKAFLLEPVSRVRAKELLNKYEVLIGQDNVIGMTVLHKTGVLNQLNINTTEHLLFFSKLVDFMIGQTNATIIFFPHSIGPDPANDDRIAAQIVFDLCQVKKNIRLITDDLSVAELKGMIGCCDFFIGERTHSVINAVAMCVPAISLSHPGDNRTVGILGKMVGMEKRIYDIRNMDINSVCALCIDAWHNREKIRKSLEYRIPRIVESSLLNKSYMQKLLVSRGLI